MVLPKTATGEKGLVRLGLGGGTGCWGMMMTMMMRRRNFMRKMDEMVAT
jgi:hypothetical protein